MTSRAGSAWLVITLLLAGCGSPVGKVLITVVFENETRTQCIKTTASKNGGADVNSNPEVLPRAGKDTLQIGLAESGELVGEVSVTIARFATPDCAGTAFASESKPTTLVHGGPVAKLEFRFVGTSGNDGGTDAGTDDGGLDAGCDTSACGNAPGECETSTATGCASDGGCRFGFKPAQTMCSAGVCNSAGTCIANVCSVLPDGMPCEDGLTCTTGSTCFGGACIGGCGMTPQCKVQAAPVSCDPVTPTACLFVPSGDFGACGAAGSRCLDGGCVPWLNLGPILNFPANSLEVTPYPTAAWTLASLDGGLCDTVISTGPTTPMVIQGECGTPTLTSTVNDAGVLVLTNTGLDVGPNARLSFVGTRPVQLVVIGNATINGVVSVAPLIPGQVPAGSAPPSCVAAVAGNATKKGGGGGGFGDVGGRGGETGGAGGGLSSSPTIPLRGGCPGAGGFRTSGESPGGLGGGAIQLIVADALTMDGGVVTASGGGGTQGAADAEGGGGGGSGGTVIIEARIVNLAGGAVTSNGGGGGEGGGVGADGGYAGAQGPIASATREPAADNPGNTGGAGGLGGDSNTLAGQNGQNGSSSAGGGGGGGAVGVIYVRGSMTCTVGSGILSGARPLPLNCN